MKKRMLALLLTAVLLLSALAGCSEEPAYIGEEKAKEIAIGDTEYSVDNVLYLTVELTEEEESAYYTVSFTAEGMAFVYKLDAESGEILEYPTFI